MSTSLEGYLSCVCVAKDELDLQRIADFAPILASLHRNFEIITCVVQKSIEVDLLKDFCQKISNLAIYEVSAAGEDPLFTAGLELALGDWILELPNTSVLEADARALLTSYAIDNDGEGDSYQLTPSNQSVADRFLSALASVALEVPVHTMTHAPRLTKRSALQTWNTRKLRSKVLRVAPQLGRGLVLGRQIRSTSSNSKLRLIRVGLRTLAHSSAKPLRWVSFFSIVGALLSILVSIGIFAVAINNRVVPGWTTTNLQISSLSFLILSVLGVLTEYIYQIAAASIDQPTFRVVREHLSPRYAFRIDPNITAQEKI